MELTVLGGSAAAPNPGDASTGYLVTSGESALLIDCGSGVVSKLREHREPRALSGVIVTHIHSDHTLDLIALRYALKYTPPGPGAPVPLHIPPGGREFLTRLGEVFAVGGEFGKEFWADVLEPQEYTAHLDGDPLHIGEFAITFCPMRHYIPVWALRIEERATGRSLTFSADTGPAAPLAAFAADTDLLLCEATLLEQEEADDPAQLGHLTAREAGEIATAARARRLVLTHLWRELGFERYLAQGQAAFDGPVDLARSGATFTI